MQQEKACLYGRYMVQNNATVRETANYYGTSKSTVHKLLTGRLMRLDKNLYALVRKVLDENKAQRHIRGGQATKQKYQHEKEHLESTE
ncbi:MAG: sporulation transcriptional regulator SpoIIID [Clostridia bacterium]|nr:sporulation transcriptional regulator SpoIIID [Clostridia bacterium]